jgi:DNA recombination protein RmuC
MAASFSLVWLGAGAFFALAVIALPLILWQRQRFAGAVNAARVNEAVILNQLASRDNDIRSLETRLRDTLASQATTERELQSTREEGAALRSRVSEAQLVRTERDGLLAENIAFRETISRLRTAIAAERKHADEKLGVLNDAREALTTQFRNIANDIFEQKQQVFKRESTDQLGAILGPLKDKIRDFEGRVEAESKERFSLIREVKSLQELNNRISRDAINLTNALKGQSQTRGAWGEVILERVLERSGLSRGSEYEVQVTMANEDGRRRQPDVIVHLPEDKDIVIDAKVSLVAYERFCSAEDDDDRTRAGKEHVRSVRRHIKQLSQKDYQNITAVRSLDFVLMFIPVEAAFATAVQLDGGLFSDAFEQNIVVVAPSTLLATLRTIQNVWRYEHQNQNAQEIAERAGALYDKFVSFVADLEEVGSRVGAVQKAYDKAHNKLVSGRGSLITRAEQMRELGARSSKMLPRNLVEMPVQKRVADAPDKRDARDTPDEEEESSGGLLGFAEE